MKRFLSLAVLLTPTLLNAQQEKQIVIETKNAALVFSTGNNKRVYQSCLGQKLAEGYAQLSGGREAYLTAGTGPQSKKANIS